jgi:Rrf2 family protein
VKLSLNKRGDYGLRIVQYLAAQDPGYKATAGEFAEQCDIPPGNVPTIVSQLSRAQILECSSGRSGGCVLARQPEDISILEVIEVLEGPLVSPQCLIESRLCSDGAHCVVHQAWNEATAGLIAGLASLSVADAADRKGGAS